MTPNKAKAQVWRDAANWVQHLLDLGYPDDTNGGPACSEDEATVTLMRKEMQRVIADCYSKQQHYEKAAARCAENARAREIKATPDAQVAAYEVHAEKVAYETVKNNAIAAMVAFDTEVMAANATQAEQIKHLCERLASIRDTYYNKYGHNKATKLHFDDCGLIVNPALEIATNKTLDPALRSGLLLEIYLMVSGCYDCPAALTLRVARALLQHRPMDDIYKSNLKHWHRRLNESYEHTRAQYGKPIYGHGYDGEVSHDNGTKTTEYKVLCLPGWRAVDDSLR
jgi:hypothetical protein